MDIKYKNIIIIYVQFKSINGNDSIYERLCLW